MSRLLIVSNRMPYTVYKKNDQLLLRESAGGLASGLRSYIESAGKSAADFQDFIWIGWPGISISGTLKEELKSTLIKKYQSYPVYITKKAIDNFYNGFCNKTIWPIFSYLPSYAVYDQNYWNHYKEVNKLFAETVLEVIKPDDVLWIHDYHLMLLPELIRNIMKDIAIGFFLHIPFPSFEIYRLLPSSWRSEILNGVLGADLIGFHTYDYAQHFLKSVHRILGYEHELGLIYTKESVVKVDTYPMGIDFSKFNDAAKSNEIKKNVKKLRNTFSASKIILSVDRQDYTKGIINRLRGYEIFLEKYPQWHNKVMLIMVVVPSRIEVDHYENTKRKIDEIVGHINGKFGNNNWIPINYQYKSLNFKSLVSLYSLSDIALITPLRDGMNLIAKEYLASKTDESGTLILSEMAGAAKELGEAVLINPNYFQEISEAIAYSLGLPEEKQKKRNQIMRRRLRKFDLNKWASDFIGELLTSKKFQNRLSAKFLTKTLNEQLVKDYLNAKRGIIFLDYDGTLVPFSNDPQDVKPDDELLDLLAKLSSNRSVQLIIISGRDRNTMQKWFGSLKIDLVAEHGAFIKLRGQDWEKLIDLEPDWKSKIIPILENYVDRVPGTFIEEKEYSVAWHYRSSDPDLGSMRAKELIGNLVDFTANISVQVIHNNKVVEVRNMGVNKGVVSQSLISKKDPDFIMAVGDDLTDEDIFKIMPEYAYTIKVGMTNSFSKFNLINQSGVLQLLKQMAEGI